MAELRGPTATTEVLADTASAEATPEEAALLTETLERLMSSLNLRDRAILAMSLQGLTTPEIAAKVQRSERTVTLVLQKIRQLLTSWNAEAVSSSD